MTTLVLAKSPRPTEVLLLLGWIFWTKVVKSIPHFVRHPSDFPPVICQIAFAYIHSIVKLWTLLKFWDCDWLREIWTVSMLTTSMFWRDPSSILSSIKSHQTQAATWQVRVVSLSSLEKRVSLQEHIAFYRISYILYDVQLERK